MVEGRSGTVLAGWLSERDSAWRAEVSTASLDPFRGYATALATQLPTRSACSTRSTSSSWGLAYVDDVRHRVQQETCGHRHRARDPIYGSRRVLRRRSDRLSAKAHGRLQAGLIAGDPNDEVTLAWTAAQDLTALYQLSDPESTRQRTQALITDLRDCPLTELARLGRTLHAWREELCAHFDHSAVSNGPTENLNLKIKNTKRIAVDTASSPTTDCDWCSTTDVPTKITHRHGSEPAVPGSSRRAGMPSRRMVGTGMPKARNCSTGFMNSRCCLIFPSSNRNECRKWLR